MGVGSLCFVEGVGGCGCWLSVDEGGDFDDDDDGVFRSEDNGEESGDGCAILAEQRSATDMGGCSGGLYDSLQNECNLVHLRPVFMTHFLNYTVFHIVGPVEHIHPGIVAG